MGAWHSGRHIWAVVASLCVAMAPICGVTSAADRHTRSVERFIESNLIGWLQDPLIIASVKAQNARSRELSDKQIAGLDLAWRQELDAASQPMIDAMRAQPLSQFLRRKENEAGGAIGEIFVMDFRGLNVGMSGVTSDLWQGDEEKFQNSYLSGGDAIFIDVPNRDESTQLLLCHVSITLVDENNSPIGAITVGINLDQL